MNERKHKSIPPVRYSLVHPQRFFREYWWIIILIILQLPAVNFALHTPFALIDDYGQALSVKYFSSWHKFLQIEKEHIINLESPRFRPMLDFLSLGTFRLFGDNAPWHHLVRLLMKLAIAFFSCKCLRLIFKNKYPFQISIAVFLSFFLFYPNNPEARLFPLELPQVLFFSLHMFFLTRLFYSAGEGRLSFLINYLFLFLSYVLFMWSKETSITFGFVSICFLLIFARTWKDYALITPFAAILGHLMAQILSIKSRAGYGTMPLTKNLIRTNALYYRKLIFLWDTSIWLTFFLVAGVLTLLFFTMRKLWMGRRGGIKSLAETVRSDPRLFFALFILVNFFFCLGFTFLSWLKVLRYAYPAGYLLVLIVAFSSGWIAEFCHRRDTLKSIGAWSRRNRLIRLFGTFIFIFCSFYVLVNYYNFLSQYALQYVIRSNEQKFLNKTYLMIQQGKRICIVGQNEYCVNAASYFEKFLPYYHGTQNFKIIRLTVDEFKKRLLDKDAKLSSKNLCFVALLWNRHHLLPHAIAQFKPKQFDALGFPMPRARRISAWLQGRDKPYYQKDAGCGAQYWYWEIYKNPIAKL